MNPVRIIGVDFSGAVNERPKSKTWATVASLTGDTLEIEYCRPVMRTELGDLLCTLDSGSVAALDFPFSVPLAFADAWQPHANTMPDLWRAAHHVQNVSLFRERVDDFAPKIENEVLRIGDMHVPGCYSCLHRVNPNMVPMTFEGMKVLHRVTQARPFHVPPLLPLVASAPVLLEVMPGAALAAFQLPYKGYKNGVNARRLKEEILDGLSGASGINLPNLSDYRSKCREDDNALDSVVAAVTAALWSSGKPFVGPSGEVVTTIKPPKSTRRASKEALGQVEADVARREGWIYVPK